MDVEAQDGDAVIVTGFDTGMPPTVERIEECRGGISLPILLGSGLTCENARQLLAHADGAIVGSYFKEGGNWKNAVDPQRVSSFMREVASLRRELD